LLAGHSAHGVTIRYAIILGNNVGVDADGIEPFAPLMHAEREATRVRNKLVRFSNFDASRQRTRLLVGATRQEIKSEVRSLIHKKEADKKVFGKVDSLFLFYFSGHGLNGQLLLEDGALTANEVGSFFHDFDATFSVGIFDACYSGSLDSKALASKGIHAAPGFNLFRELPEEVLSAKGSIWYVSSSSNQESFEDEQLGGVFTYFFLEGLERANRSGPGITLESIWQYARENTVEYTAQRKRKQVPEQYISKLRTTAPIYFSFPMARSASLILSEDLEGRFALAYKKGTLTEVFDKQKGALTKLAVYPGAARLILVDTGANLTTRSITLKPKSTLLLTTMKDPPPSPSVGQQSQTLFEKGVGIESKVTATQIGRGLSVLSGAGYGFDVTHEEILNARHGFFLPTRFDLGHVLLGLDFQYGFSRQRFPAWTHDIHEIGGKAAAGFAFDRRQLRIGVSAAFEMAYLRQIFENGDKRSALQLRPMVEMTLLYPTKRKIQGELFAAFGPISSPGVGVDSTRLWHLAATFGLSFFYRVY
jgi:hypothetical protein